jgi:serine/threonine protein kinase
MASKLSLILSLLISKSQSGFPVPGETTLRLPGAEYAIEEFLDSGSSSGIYAATKISGPDALPQHAAVKFVCPENEEYLKHVDAEVIALSKLNKLDTSNIVHIIASTDVLELEGGPRCRAILLSRTGRDFDRFVSSTDDFNPPVLEGESKVNPKGISLEAFVASVGLLLLEALARIHEAGVTHGDIHNYNVALSYPLGDQPVLIDFGGAIMRDSVSEIVFTGRKEEDTTQLRDFLITTVHQRMDTIFGKLHRPIFAARSALIQLLKTTKTSIELHDMLMGYLKDEVGIEWDAMRPHQIIYHAT